MKKPDIDPDYPWGKRGLASMSPAAVRKIASQGGIAAHEQGTAHEWTKAEAKVAGRKGGMARRTKKKKAKR